MPADQENQQTDYELVAAANRGEAAAFEAIYDRYRDWALRTALRYTRDHELALDAMQETFLDLLRRFPGFELRAEMKTFLYPVVKHSTLALLRSQRRQRNLMSRDTRPASADQTESVPLSLAMESLSFEHREVVMLRFVDDLPLAAIAQALEIPLGTVKSRLHHALQQLRTDESLKNLWE